MSVLPDLEPATAPCPGTPELAAVIDARMRDLGGFTVGRVLPSTARKLIGPFIFFDHMGPAAFPPGRGIDVRPHPHIGLATVTYLFEGEIVHRDSLGSHQPIRPGDV
ncbi:MAG TPA: pirin family protein, partial [Steroidobacteraceae bacterium]|nr:pirin family protein [Steroidobacteraceae bacterium]